MVIMDRDFSGILQSHRCSVADKGPKAARVQQAASVCCVVICCCDNIIIFLLALSLSIV